MDIRLDPDNVSLDPLEKFTVTVIIEPNDQRVETAQVVLRYDPDRLRVKSSEFNDDSPLGTQLAPDDQFDNDIGEVILSAGPTKNILVPPSTPFILGWITFRARTVSDSTDIDFVLFGDTKTFVGLAGADILDDVFGTTVEINEPTPTPTAP